MRTASSAAPREAGTAAAVKTKARAEILQVLDHVGGAGDEAAARGEALREGAHSEIDPVLEPEELADAGAPLAQDAHTVGLVDHQPGAVALRALDDLGQRADVSLHREDPVHDHERATPIGVGALEHLLELVHLVVPERPQLGPR